MSDKNLVERVSEGGNLFENLKRIDVDTWEDAVAVYNARDFSTSTNNMAIYRYRSVDGHGVFNLLGKEGNLFVPQNFRKKAYDDISQNEFFMPQGEMKEHVMSAINSDKSVQVNYSGLNIKFRGESDDFVYIEVSYNNTAEEKKLLEAAYGANAAPIGKKFWLLKEEVVLEQLDGKPDEMIARACFFYLNRSFDASDRFIGCGCAVRGVRLEKVGEADDAQKVDYAGLASQFKRGEFDPKLFGQHLDRTSASNVVLGLAAYISQQKQ